MSIPRSPLVPEDPLVPEESGPTTPAPGWIAPPPGLLDPAAPAEELDRTVVVDRLPERAWVLAVEGGPVLPLPGPRAVLGRRPDGAGGGAVELAIPDPTRTVSQVHARLDLVDGVWTVTDLHATNGVVVVGPDGTGRLLEPGATAPVTEVFSLGRVVLRLLPARAGEAS